MKSDYSSNRSADTKMKKRDTLNQISNKKRCTPNTTARRGFLRHSLATLGAGVTTVLGFSRVVSAGEQRKKEKAKAAAAEYGSRRKVSIAAEEHAEELVTMLADQGYLRKASVGALPFEDYFDRLKPYSEAEQGVFVFGTISDGEPRTKIQFKKQLSDSQELRLVITPQVSESYAVLVEELITGEHLTSLTIGGSDSDVAIQSCDCMDYSSECRIYCNNLGSCSCAEITFGDYCTDDSGKDCTYCSVDYSSCSSCGSTYSCS